MRLSDQPNSGEHPAVTPYTLQGASTSPGARNTYACTIKLDTCAVQHSWIDPSAARRANLRLEPALNAQPFESALFPHQRFTPKHTAKAAIRLNKFNFTIEVVLYLLPSAGSPRQNDVLRGDWRCEQYDLLKFRKHNL